MCFYEAAGWSDGSKLIVDNVKAELTKVKFNPKMKPC